MWAIKMNLIGTCFRICINVVLRTWLKWGSLALAYKFVLSDDATSFPSKLITNQIALKKGPDKFIDFTGWWFWILEFLWTATTLRVLLPANEVTRFSWKSLRVLVFYANSFYFCQNKFQFLWVFFLLFFVFDHKILPINLLCFFNV